MKGFVVVILIFALITSSLISVLGGSADMLVSPVPYITRLNNVITAFPEVKMISIKEAWEESAPEYEGFIFDYDDSPISHDGGSVIFDVIFNVANFFSKGFGRFANFFTNFSFNIARLWNNLKMTFNHWISPLKTVALNTSAIMTTIFTSRDWFVCLGLAFIPYDWQRSENYKVPLFGNISERPLDQYMGTNWR